MLKHVDYHSRGEDVQSPFLLRDCEVIESDIDDGAKVYKEARLRNCIIHKDVSIGDFSHIVRTTIGARSVIERRCVISNCTIGEASSIANSTVINNYEIGNYCAISWNVTIGGGEHPVNSLMMINRKFLFDNDDSINGLHPVLNEAGKIGSDVWIGAGASIKTGVHIGDGAVVGANAVVTKDVSPYTIVAGVPAKPIRKRFSDEIIKELLEIRWWEYPKETLQPYHDCFVGDLTPEKLRKIRELKNLR